MVTALVIVPVVAFAYAPSRPTLTATPGEQPNVAVLEWTASDTAARYAVSVATTAAGPYRVVGETDAATLSYSFTDGIGGVPYFFRVTAINGQGEQSSPAAQPTGPVTSAWVSEPHRTADRSTNKCQSCHVPHRALASPLMRTEITTSTPSQTATCLSCHDGKIASAADVAGGTRDSFGLASGHALDTTQSAGGLTERCASCHDPHASSAANPMMRQKEINGTQVSSAGNEWCLACHDDDASWYPAAYPPPTAPQTDTAGYPVSGTWLGEGAYTGPGNAHRLVPETTQTVGGGKQTRRGAGDCLYCHAAHRGANAYDGLVSTFRPTTAATLAADKSQGDYAALCFGCHGGATPSGFATAPVDVKRFVVGGAENAGHSIVTSGGLLPVGAPLPCYECHNPHGSVGGNDSLISDVRGASLSTTGTPTSVREFCFTCHTTPGAAKGWDSVAETYTAVAPAQNVVGISRTGGVLSLPNVNGHDQGDGRSCYVCHGSNYGEGGKNVHNPAPGNGPSHVSDSQMCFGAGCHAASGDVADVHEEFVGSPVAKYPQYGSSCELCHDNDDPQRIDWAADPGSMKCSRCHPVYHGGQVGDPVPHDGRETAHTPTSASGACVGCHDAALPAIHGATTYEPTNCNSCHTQFPDANAACDTCHTSNIVWGKTADCVGCHDEKFDGETLASGHYSETTHTAAPFSAAYQGAGADGTVASGGRECSACHSAALANAHAATSTSGGSVLCVECHADTTIGAADVVGNDWPTRKCTDCHDTGSATTHDTYASAHSAEVGSCAGTGMGCHFVTDIAELHAASRSGGAPKYQSCANADPTDPTACHTVADTKPVAFDLAASCGEGTGSCHAEKTPTNHGYDFAKHAAALGSGTISMGGSPDDPDHGENWSTTEDCSLCHYSDLGLQHAANCSACHAGANPVATLGTWDKSCQQGACHPSIHTGMTPNHNGAYWNSSASCNSCHTGVPSFPGEVDCTGCHDPVQSVLDSTPPTTSSDAQESYAGTATIHLTAVDNPGGRGVDRTYYILDGGAAVQGTTVEVLAPPFGSAQHTLQFYSVDAAANAEAPTPDLALVFTIDALADTTPPTGSMSVNDGDEYTNSEAATVDSAVTDEASGLDQMSIDPGTSEFGPWIDYASTSPIDLPAGDGSKIVRVQYRDNSGNATTLIDTILLDTEPPTTTSDALASYTGSADITLEATDTPAGSGVATTKYRVDGGAEQSGTSISIAPPASGSVSHTIYFWSVDNATNEETENSETFTVSAPASENIPPTGSVVINADDTWTTSATVTLSLLAEDTGGSGLALMRFSNDDSSWSAWEAYSTSKEWTLSAAEGAKDVYVQYRDFAGNSSDSASDGISLDSIDPATTCSAVSGNTYSGAQLFTLSPSDIGGSGVASTWWQLDSTGGAWTSGTSVLVAAPAEGTVTHTLYWYSRDVATNEETIQPVTFSISAPGAGGTATLQFRTDASFGGWSYVYWEVQDVNGTPVPGMSFTNDDTGHAEVMWADFEVPAGETYIMYGSWGPMPDGPDEDSATYVVTPEQTTPGAIVTWWWY